MSRCWTISNDLKSDGFKLKSVKCHYCSNCGVSSNIFRRRYYQVSVEKIAADWNWNNQKCILLNLKNELDKISFYKNGSIGRKYVLLARNPRVLFNMRDIGFLWKMFVHSVCFCNSGHSVWELSKDFQKKSQIRIETSSQRTEIDPR